MATPALTAIRAVHSAILLVMLSAIAWLVATGVTGRRDRSVASAAALVAIESAVYVANDGVCPLTPLAERHGAVRGSVSDIWLPDVLARTLPAWSGGLVLLAILLHGRGIARSSATRTWLGSCRSTGPGCRADSRGARSRR
jgi:hypothetical protein